MAGGDLQLAGDLADCVILELHLARVDPLVEVRGEGSIAHVWATTVVTIYTSNP